MSSRVNLFLCVLAISSLVIVCCAFAGRSSGAYRVREIGGVRALTPTLSPEGRGGGKVQAVSILSLLPQMTDMTWLTHRPNPAFTMAQASSYDRASNPGPHQDWFANSDHGQFVRTEMNGPRREWVLADLKGPGAVVRIWSANPQGAIRFYFDGETIPRIQEPMDALLSGGVAPLVEPFGYVSSAGHNLYFPIPYSKSLKITVDGSLRANPADLYYHLGNRTYAPGTAVETFTWDQVLDARAEMARVSAMLNVPEFAVPRDIKREGRNTMDVPPGAYQRIAAIAGPGCVYQFRAEFKFLPPAVLSKLTWKDPRQPHNILRQLVLTAIVDGHKVIESPLGDFFGSAPDLNPFAQLPFDMQSNGTMDCRLPMAFRHRIAFFVRNVSNRTQPVMFSASYRNQPVGRQYYALHAQWGGERARTRPLRDMNFLKVKGEGFWLGSMLQVSNPDPAWWGEGDEKVFVDGEAFPSTFGTGTEDYYGYGWGSPTLFSRPYHAQTRADGPGNRGQVSVNRFQIFDPIPYKRSLSFNLEMWHWADVVATYVHTVYWYAPPDQQQPVAIDRKLLLPVEIPGPAPVKGAIEGENLQIVEQHGGTLENQEGFWQLSNGAQLWWRDLEVGDKISLAVAVAKAGRYEVFGNFCHARDYGIHKMRLNGQEIAPIDFYSPDLSWKRMSLGTFDLPAGKARLDVECVGANPNAVPSRMFGLDYLVLVPRSHGATRV